MAVGTVGYKRFGFEMFFKGDKAKADMAKFQKSLGNFKRFVTVAFAGKILKDMAEFGKAMHSMSLRTGMSVDNLSSLRNAFISAGSGAGNFEKTINNISDGLRGLSMGRGEFAAKLGMLGISPYTETGRLKSGDEALYDIADWAKSQEGIMSKQDILYRLQELFGIDTALGEKLLEGGEAFQKLQEEAKERMGSIDDETSKKLTSMKTSWDEFWGAVTNTTANVAGELSPVVSGLLDGLKWLVKALGDCKEAVATVIGGFTAVSVLMKGIGLVAGGVSMAATAIWGLVAAIAGLLGYLGGKLTAWFFKPDTMEKNNKSIDEYRDKDNYTKVDLERMKADFASGKISKEKDERQYYTALNLLRNSFGGRYEQMWDTEASQNFQKISEYGYNPFLGSKSESLFQPPTNLEQSSSSSSKTVNNTSNVNVDIHTTGDIDRDAAEALASMVNDANVIVIEDAQ